MASKELLNLLNEAIARELQVSIQYMWQHVLWSGVKGYAVQGEIKSIAIEEMKHSEAIAERLYYLGEKPTTKPTPIFVGDDLKAMLTQDVKDEEGGIKLYRQIIEVAKKEADETTYKLFQGILSDEEGHHDFFTTALEEV
jgi:bacterioferritin